MSQLVTPTAPDTATRSRRVPWTVWALSTVVGLLAPFTSYGAVYFTFYFEDPEPGLGSWMFVILFFAINITAATAALALVRGSRTAWRLLVGYAVLGVLWCVAKLVFWSEEEALVFGVANLLGLWLLLTARTRRHVA